MPTTLYDNAVHEGLTGQIDYDTDVFYCMLLAAGYVPDKGGHTRRSQLTNEISGTGYTAGGFAVTVTVAKDPVTHKTTINLGGAALANSTLTARHAVYYKRRGGAAASDELVACNDFGADVSSVAATLTVNPTVVTADNS